MKRKKSVFGEVNEKTRLQSVSKDEPVCVCARRGGRVSVALTGDAAVNGNEQGKILQDKRYTKRKKKDVSAH